MTLGMRKQVVAAGPGGRIVAMDTITAVTPDDAGCVAVSGSHGGVSSGAYALAVPLKLAVFNDAGVGKQGAGIAALAMLQALGRAGAAVSHHSACIGDAHDSWQHGVISHLNAQAAALGLKPGDRLCQVLPALVGLAPPTGIEPVSGA